MSTSILFVCMGNICRSPMAEAVMRHLVEAAGLSSDITVESAATHSYHLGHEPHPETCRELAVRGVEVGEQTSRLITSEDLTRFDYVVAMDEENLANIMQVAGSTPITAKVSKLLDHADGTSRTEVPDPYYVGGYDVVYDLVHAGCIGLLAQVAADTEP